MLDTKSIDTNCLSTEVDRSKKEIYCFLWATDNAQFGLQFQGALSEKEFVDIVSGLIELKIDIMNNIEMNVCFITESEFKALIARKAPNVKIGEDITYTVVTIKGVDRILLDKTNLKPQIMNQKMLMNEYLWQWDNTILVGFYCKHSHFQNKIPMRWLCYNTPEKGVTLFEEFPSKQNTISLYKGQEGNSSIDKPLDEHFNLLPKLDNPETINYFLSRLWNVDSLETANQLYLAYSKKNFNE